MSLRPSAGALAAAALAVAALLACDGPSVGPGPRFDFLGADPGWTAGFADVAVGEQAAVGFVAGHRALAAPLIGNGLYQRGLNVSDDLCMWFAGREGGFEPGAEYDVTFRVGIASPAGAGCEVGQAASTYVKVGASTIEPARVEVAGMLRLNLDQGTPPGDGANALTVGDIRNGLPGCEEGRWGARVLDSGARAIRVRAADDGSIWFVVLTDSAFEGRYEVAFLFLDAEVARVR